MPNGRHLVRFWRGCCVWYVSNVVFVTSHVAERCIIAHSGGRDLRPSLGRRIGEKLLEVLKKIRCGVE